MLEDVILESAGDCLQCLPVSGDTLLSQSACLIPHLSQISPATRYSWLSSPAYIRWQLSLTSSTTSSTYSSSTTSSTSTSTTTPTSTSLGVSWSISQIVRLLVLERERGERDNAEAGLPAGPRHQLTMITECRTFLKSCKHWDLTVAGILLWLMPCMPGHVSQK